MAKKIHYTRDDYSFEDRVLMDALYDEHFVKNFGSDLRDFSSKELEENQVLNVKITKISGSNAIGETTLGQSVSIDLLKEDKAIKRLGFPPMEVVEGSNLDVVVFMDRNGSYNGSLEIGRAHV